MIIREMPYTNLHDLNIDWILKIIKDFQDRYQNLDETFQNMLQQIITAGENAVEAINNNEETALEAIRVFLEQCIQALDTETSGKITEIQNVTNNQLDAINAAGTNQIGLIDQDGAAKLSAISSAGAAQVNIINGLITSLPQTYEDSVNQLQIINAVLNQTYNYPPLVQGHYADAGESDSKTLVADNYRVSTLLSTGCASRKIKIQITGASGIIRDIIYWTGWGASAVAHGVPVSTSASDEKTIYEYTFPATATYFTIVFCSDYNMLTQFLVSDLQVTLEWQFTALESIELHEHGFDVSNTNALEFVIPGNTNLTIEEGSEIDEIDVSGGSKSVATSHKIKDAKAREDITDLNSAFDSFKEEISEYVIGTNMFDQESPTIYPLYIDKTSGTMKNASSNRLVSVRVTANTNYLIHCGGTSHKLVCTVHSTPQNTRQAYNIYEGTNEIEIVYNSGSDTFICIQLFTDEDTDQTASDYYSSIIVAKYINTSAIDTVARNDIEKISVTNEKSVNLFDIESATIGYYINASNGGFISRADHFYELIPITEPGTYRYYNDANLYGTTSAKKIVIYNSNKTYKTVVSATHFGDSTDTRWYGVEFTITSTDIESGYAYFGVSQHIDNIQRFMVVNGEYPSEYVTYFPERTVFNDAYVKEEHAIGTTKNNLYNRICLFFGDSICNGSSANDNKSGWAGRIGQSNQMIWRNFGQNGAVICTQPGRSSITSQVNNALEEYSETKPDYAILEGGTNDADLSAIQIGTYTEDNYAGIYDTTTFSGALETLIFNVLSNWPHTRLGYIVAQKMGRSADTREERKEFFNRAMEICNKWGIPFVNLWDNSHLNPLITSMYDSSKTSTENIEAGSMYTDGQHLTPSGYDYLTPIIEAWMRTL